MKIRTFAKLGDICDVSAGQGAPQGDSNYCDNGTPFVKAGNLNELIQGKKETEIQKVSEDVAKKHKLKKYPAGSLLFAKSGMSCMKGYVYQLKNDSYVVSHLAIVKPKKDSSDYIEYCLRHIKPNSLVKDEAYPSISLQDISNLEIPLPSLEVQVKIADQLSKCTQIINKHKEQLEKYDFLIKSRFIEMFGDPATNPKKWEIKILDEVCKKITDGKHGGCKVEDNSDYYYVGAREIFDLNIHYETAQEITKEDFEKDYKRCNLEIGDFCIVNTGATIGKTAIAKDVRTTKTLLQKSVALLKTKENLLSALYLQYSYITNPSMYKVENASAQPNLLLSKIRETKIMLPPLFLQNDFATFVQQIDKSKFEIWLTLQNYGIIEKRVF